MAIEKMTLVNIMGKMSNLNEILTKIIQSEYMHFKPVIKNVNLKNFENLNEKNPYSDLCEKTLKILKILKIKPYFNNYESINSQNFDEIKKIILNLFEKLNSNISEMSKLENKISLMEKSLKQLSHMKKIDINLKNIFTTNYIDIIFGKMPVDNYLKLNYFDKSNLLFIPIEKDKVFCWGLFIAPKHERAEYEKIIKSLYFEQLHSSNYDDKKLNSEINYYDLANEIKISKENLLNLKLELENYKKIHSKFLLCIYSKIKTMQTSFDFRKFAVSNGKFFYLNGFIIKKNLEKFKQVLNEISGVVIETVNETKLSPPIKLKTNFLFKPFELLIHTFGIPNYDTINPTSFIGLIYCCLFGLMFGDFGQGLCLFIIGFLLWKMKKSILGLVITRCGIASSIFGAIYGSFFGFENFFSNLWPRIGLFKNLPFNLLKGQNAIIILLISLILGMAIIFISISINTIINFKNKNFKEAVISNNGLTGLVFYGSIIYSAISLILFKINVLNLMFLIFFFLIPIILIFLKQPILNFFTIKILKRGLTTKFNFLNSLLETFEAILNYFTNTLSFLRVGGFAMSHAALMLVIIKFYEKSSNIILSPLILIFGNIFVIALEGLVVSIQVLRLIYYEMFSRFYKPNGELFQPAKIEF